MNERDFVTALIVTIKAARSTAVVLKPCDSFTLGIPDILAWVPGAFHRPLPVAIECKELSPLMDNAFHKGRRTGLMLKHPFTGPQISTLRALQGVGVEAFGLVRASSDTAFVIPPECLDPRTGNFTHEEMLENGTPIVRAKGLWRLPFLEIT